MSMQDAAGDETAERDSLRMLPAARFAQQQCRPRTAEHEHRDRGQDQEAAIAGRP
jgi:hypothetical protein